MSKSAAKAVKDETTTPNRQTRRKQKTRASLIKAANEVFIAKGVDSASVTDITEAADVAYGTFYNYFTSVEEIAKASVEMVLKEINDQIEITPGGSKDPAIQIAKGTRRLFHRVVSEPAFNWLSQKPDLVAEIIFDSVASDAAEDVAMGIESGDFVSPGDIPTAQKFCVWGFTGVMRQLANSPDDIEYTTDEVIKILLRVLGVPDNRVGKIIKASKK